MPSALPDGDPAPPTARCRRRRSRARRAPVRVLRARAVLHGALRLLRLQHLHRRRELGDVPRRLADDVRRRRDRRDPAGPPGARRRATCRSTTVFFGGGTPTLLPPATWPRCVAAIDDEFGLAPRRRGHHRGQPRQRRPPADLDGAAGRRLHPGLVRHAVAPCRTCCASLDRTHDPRAGARRSVAWARAAGFEQVSLDLIYGTPGESLGRLARPRSTRRWRCAPDHVSAYALIVEDGTALARQVRRGEVPMPDDDDLADKYLLADERARARRAAAGTRCRTGRATEAAAAGTTSATGPAATGGASGPARTRTSAACAGGTSSTRRRTPSGSPPGVSPAHAREVLDDGDAGASSGCCWRSRLRDGLPVDVLDAGGPRRRAGARGRRARWSRAATAALVLTRRGRLLADAVVRDLLP